MAVESAGISKGMRAVVTGGGTAGHINPALSIARILREEGLNVLYIGSNAEDCLDRQLVGRTDYDFLGLDIVTPLLKVSFQTFRSIMSIIRAYFRCRRLFKKERPAVVVGTGGFVSLPVMLAAVSLGIPTAIHEQNVSPGYTNKWLSGRVSRVFLTFAGSACHFSKRGRSRAVVTGVPLLNTPEKVSAEEYAKRVVGGLRVLVVGGSLGSAFLNDLVTGLDFSEKTLERLNIKLSCGHAYYDRLISDNNSRSRLGSCLEIVPYITDMKSELEIADLMVCRAGSSTVFEGIMSAVPAIVIPSPNVAGDHQRPNAKYWESTGAAIYAEESEITSAKLSEIVADFAAHPEKLSAMRAAAELQDMPDASVALRRELRALLRKGGAL